MTALRPQLALALAAAAAGAGCGGGGDGDRGGELTWARPPVVYRPADLPHDRVLLGTLRNTSSHGAMLRARQVTVQDAGGHRLVADARFTTGFAHSLYGVFQQPSPTPPMELARLGLLVWVDAGKTVPVNVNYRLGPHPKLPITVVLGDHGRLVVRARTRVAGRRP